MHGLIIFWSHALAAALYCSLVVWELRRGIRIGGGKRMLLLALALTSCWAWLAALDSPGVLAAAAETARNLIWVGVLYRLGDMARPNAGQHGVAPVYAAVAGVLGLQFLIDAAPLLLDLAPPGADALARTAIVLRLAVAAGALVLVHNLYGQAAPASRGPIRLAMLALALMWGYDFNLYTLAYFGAEVTRDLVAWRGLAAALTVPLFALGGARGEGWIFRPSRAATFQSLSLLAICAYFIAMAVLAAIIRDGGFDWAVEAAVVVMALLTLAAILLMPSARARGWAKVKLSKHLFAHRYDYRSEWLRFTATLGACGADAPPLGERVIKAFADILDSPGGMLLTLDEGGLERAALWHWNGDDDFAAGSDDGSAEAFWTALAGDGRIVDFAARRLGRESSKDAARAIPAALLADPGAWVGIPLIHEQRMVALAVLAPPEYRRPLDWEDFDLLRTAGRQAASSLAEARSQQALLDAQRFEEFNRRFAFILHDIKNLASQLSLLTRNAERHADNPEFRADMLATLKSSVGKLGDLLQRIAPSGEPRRLNPRSVELRNVLAAAVAAHHLRHDVRLCGDTGALVVADADALEQAVGHLLHNAVDASPPGAPVEVRVHRGDGSVSIVIADEGAGMPAEFVRNQLFQPFASTKSSGFGVGAFEARSLISAMNGRLAVDSRPGRGTRFTITLPLAPLLRKIA